MPKSFPLDVDALLAVLNHLNLGVYITDCKRRILLWNRKAEEITGYRAGDVVGKACHEQILVHVDKDGHRLCTTRFCPLRRSITLGKESQEPVLIYAKGKERQRIAVSVSTAPLRDAAGQIVGGIEVFRDATDQVHDMEFAQRIQRHIFPQVLPSVPGFQFDVRYYPHDLVGGDFYDIRLLGPNMVGFMVADVRGHGVSAALYTMWLKSLGESLISLAADPGKFITSMGRELKKFVVEDSFATAFYGVLDAGRAELTYTNAGHPAPLHFHAAAGQVTQLDSHGLPLGILADAQYEAATLRLEPGDLLLCYTDGIAESADARGERLGANGLAALLREEIEGRQKDILERIFRHVKQQCGSVSLTDDVLLLSLERKA